MYRITLKFGNPRRNSGAGAGGIEELSGDNEVVGDTGGNIDEVARVVESGQREIGEGGVDTVNPAVSFAVSAREERLVELFEVGEIRVPVLCVKVIVNAWRV